MTRFTTTRLGYRSYDVPRRRPIRFPSQHPCALLLGGDVRHVTAAKDKAQIARATSSEAQPPKHASSSLPSRLLEKGSMVMSGQTRRLSNHSHVESTEVDPEGASSWKTSNNVRRYVRRTVGPADISPWNESRLSTKSRIATASWTTRARHRNE